MVAAEPIGQTGGQDAGQAVGQAAGQSDEQAIVDAVILANRLERDYWADPHAFPSWDSLFSHYRRGYSADIAERMTDYTLAGEGDLATWVPSDIHVVEHDADTALAYFPTPADFGAGSFWGFDAYMIVRLRREESKRWVIYWATDSAMVPPAP